ncbi:hypothetical protein ACXZ66_05420 [Corynebacterium sp. S7]
MNSPNSLSNPDSEFEKIANATPVVLAVTVGIAVAIREESFLLGLLTGGVTFIILVAIMQVDRWANFALRMFAGFALITAIFLAGLFGVLVLVAAIVIVVVLKTSQVEDPVDRGRRPK